MNSSDAISAARVETQAFLHPAIYNHSARVHLIAAQLAESTEADLDALGVAALFHDAGASDAHDGAQRFELEGADAAARFLRLRGWSPERIEPVWQAIALHTTPGVAERFGGIPLLVRTAVLIDFGKPGLPHPADRELADALEALPRLEIEKVLARTVVDQARRAGVDAAQKAPPASWPGRLVAGDAFAVDGVNPNF